MTHADAIAALEAAKLSGDVAAIIAAADALARAGEAPKAKAARKPRAPKDARPDWFTAEAKPRKGKTRIKYSLVCRFAGEARPVRVNAWQDPGKPIAIGHALSVAIEFMRWRASAGGAGGFRAPVAAFESVELIGGAAFDAAECSQLTEGLRAAIPAAAPVTLGELLAKRERLVAEIERRQSAARRSESVWAEWHAEEERLGAAFVELHKPADPACWTAAIEAGRRELATLDARITALRAGLSPSEARRRAAMAQDFPRLAAALAETFPVTVAEAEAAIAAVDAPVSVCEPESPGELIGPDGVAVSERAKEARPVSAAVQEPERVETPPAASPVAAPADMGISITDGIASPEAPERQEAPKAPVVAARAEAPPRASCGPNSGVSATRPVRHSRVSVSGEPAHRPQMRLVHAAPLRDALPGRVRQEVRLFMRRGADDKPVEIGRPDEPHAVALEPEEVGRVAPELSCGAAHRMQHRPVQIDCHHGRIPYHRRIQRAALLVSLSGGPDQRRHGLALACRSSPDPVPRGLARLRLALARDVQPRDGRAGVDVQVALARMHEPDSRREGGVGQLRPRAVVTTLRCALDEFHVRRVEPDESPRGFQELNREVLARVRQRLLLGIVHADNRPDGARRQLDIGCGRDGLKELNDVEFSDRCGRGRVHGPAPYHRWPPWGYPPPIGVGGVGARRIQENVMGWIEVKDASTGEERLLNPRHIVMVVPGINGRGCSVLLSTGQEVHLDELYRNVAGWIETAERAGER